MKNLNSISELKEILKANRKAFVLLYKKGSDSSENAVQNLNVQNRNNNQVFIADVSTVRDIHPEYKITSVPTFMVFEDEQLRNIVKGSQSEKVYHDIINGVNSTGQDKQKNQKSVVVYTSPTCAWCTTLKNYLRQHQVQFREFDVSTNPDIADRMVQKSGQRGIPQTEINGNMIVGFDKKRIDQLLEIS